MLLLPSIVHCKNKRIIESKLKVIKERIFPSEIKNVLLSGAAFVLPVVSKLTEDRVPIDLCTRESPVTVAGSAGQCEFSSF